MFIRNAILVTLIYLSLALIGWVFHESPTQTTQAPQDTRTTMTETGP